MAQAAYVRHLSVRCVQIMHTSLKHRPDRIETHFKRHIPGRSAPLRIVPGIYCTFFYCYYTRFTHNNQQFLQKTVYKFLTKRFFLRIRAVFQNFFLCFRIFLLRQRRQKNYFFSRLTLTLKMISRYGRSSAVRRVPVGFG